MNTLTVVAACLLGIIAIILGAFGAHAFKKIISKEKLISFEVGLRYQMYSSIVLLLLGLQLDFKLYAERMAVYSIICGTVLFSGSIFLLSFATYWNKNLKFLGPVTPLGGLFMIIGWLFLLFSFVSR